MRDAYTSLQLPQGSRPAKLQPRRDATVLKVRRVSPDGDCLFHAIGIQIGVPGSTLRKECADAYANEDEETRDLMCEGEASNWEEYSKILENGDMYGGHNEMILLSKLYGLCIIVYGRGEGGVVEMTRVCSHDPRPKRVHVLYNGTNHYDALVRQKSQPFHSNL